ncbi:MAG: adaptor protein MecA [Lachnospiraceae bacterium]|nr:adaptor protein MecA [Lachnospiraceae bacterium]
MKIELINENKIKCTLNNEDLINHNMVITEFAYGSEKARAFFRDIMLRAAEEFGFEAGDDVPLMIEAVPLSQDSMILFVTKVEDPEMLDTRFSRFTNLASHEDYDEDDDDDTNNFKIHVETNIDDGIESPEDILDVVKYAVRNAVEGLARAVEVGQNPTENFIPLNKSAKRINTDKQDNNSSSKPVVKIAVYKFDSLDDVCNAASTTYDYSTTDNTLYKDTVSGSYYLVVSSNTLSTDRFAKLTNILSEYGKRQHTTYISATYYEEHYMCVIRSSALQTLGA